MHEIDQIRLKELPHCRGASADAHVETTCGLLGKTQYLLRHSFHKVETTSGFIFYLTNFGMYNPTYGTIGGIIVMLLWGWIMNIVLLFGAEIDAEMERARQLAAGIDAESTLQLPPRDTRRSDKLKAKERKLISDAARWVSTTGPGR